MKICKLLTKNQRDLEFNYDTSFDLHFIYYGKKKSVS